jgi:tRNA (guanine-N7-)-methyltransferase
MPRVRQHVNPLRSAYQTGAAPSVPLPDGGEVEVELGCADARFLFRRALAHPAVLCVGVEIREDLVVDVNQRAASLLLGNLRAVFANLNRDLDALFPDERLARAYVNFPDPWWKTRHHKRRIMTSELAAVIARKLVPGGALLFQSDVWDLALDALDVLEAEPALENLRGPWSFLHDDHGFGARSRREERCIEEGMKIWRLLYRRR